MKRLCAALFCIGLIAACKPAVPVDESVSASSISSVEDAMPIRETQNVTYQGTVETIGVGIVMEGTQQLRLSDGRLILLESRDIELNKYLGKKVSVFGATRPTVEGSQIIMRVEEVMLLEDETSSASSDALSEVSSATESSSAAAVSVAAASIASSKIASSKAAVSSAAPPSSAPAVSSAAATASASVSVDVMEHANAMAKDNMAAANWSQQYCTAHIGFCIPVHRNWWFKSFGTTTTSLWHVEISNAEMNNLGEGPIVIRLLSGNSVSKKATDGQVRVQGDTVVGFKDWDDNEHFEISAPANLQAAVAYLTENLTATAAGQ